MFCTCYLLFQCVYYYMMFGYPLKCLYEANKAGQAESKWIYYFLYITILQLCEMTVLFPLKWLLGKIDFCMFPTVKALFALWLYFPCEKNGINLLDKLIGQHFEKIFVIINGKIGKYAGFIGIENKDAAAQQKKIE